MAKSNSKDIYYSRRQDRRIDAAADTGGTTQADIDNSIALHVAAPDPHTGYLTPAEGDAAYAPVVHTHVMTDVSDLPTLSAGTYTPTLTATANVDSVSITTGPWSYLRVGNTVNVAGRLAIDATTAATLTSFRASLPIASTYDTVGDVAGAGGAAYTGDYRVLVVNGELANHEAAISLIAAANTSVAAWVTFQYRVE